MEYWKLHRDNCPKGMAPLFEHMPVILFRDQTDKKRVFWVDDCNKREGWIKMMSEPIPAIPKNSVKITKEDFCRMTQLSR